jgi:hypothetical protein
MSQLFSPHLYLVADETTHPLDLVRDMLLETEDLPRVVEAVYLAHEPGLLEIMRGLTALPEEERFRLLQYLSRNRERHIYLSELPSGALIMETVEQSELNETS